VFPNEANQKMISFLPQSEQELLLSVFSQEIQSISVQESKIEFKILHQAISSIPFVLSISVSKEENSIISISPPKFTHCAPSEDDFSKIDSRLFANFEVFAKREWFLKLNSLVENNNTSSKFTLIENDQLPFSFSELLINYFSTLFNEFEDKMEQQPKEISKNRNDDDDENESDSDDEDIFDDTQQSWSEFSKTQHEKKLQRQKETLLEQQNSSDDSRKARGPARSTDDKYFVLIHEYHHIYCSAKQKFMVEKAHDFDLQGIMLRGKPGRCIIEGNFEDVTTWSRLVKSLRWQRCTEVGVFETMKEVAVPWIFAPGFGYVKCESEAELKRMLVEETTSPEAVKFFSYAFPSIIHPNRTIS
jgi:hypothetical protein